MKCDLKPKLTQIVIMYKKKHKKYENKILHKDAVEEFLMERIQKDEALASYSVQIAVDMTPPQVTAQTP